MLDQEKYSDPEELITCPYDVVHQVTRKRMAIHLSKCRKQHPELVREMKTCEFNVVHRVPKAEYDFHKSECPDRETFYNHKYRVGSDPNDAVQKLNENVRKKLDIPDVEPSWDTETNPQQNIINDIRRDAEQRGVLQNHTNEPPAVLKAKREEDRRRTRERMNEQERSQVNLKTKYSSTAFMSPEDTDTSSMVSAASSVGSRRTMASESDVSYRSAMTTTQNMMESFQIVQSKKRGRGTALKSSMTGISPSQVGIGRGRIQHS